MAQIKQLSVLCRVLGGGVSDFVFQKKKGGEASVRVATAHAGVTGGQSAWRAVYRVVDRTWITMTTLERNKWRVLPWKKTWSNYAYFMHFNLLRQRAGLPIVRDPALL